MEANTVRLCTDSTLGAAFRLLGLRLLKEHSKRDQWADLSPSMSC